ncbi:type II toxin-antitoxin system HicB family antitoxin [Photobacterium leiognathi]|uniref:type II toxin-antitoxin system HicB family antitoxin n=1 Tax=Photobacterium leiognathi TaxID=553611 RepID=UPI002981D53E|nr:type II toxin-antitoxin system HicB family antitoxin [Photobacterium leiognathi]
MIYPVAIEKGSDTTAFGVVIPDLKGCSAAGETYEEALVNAKEAIEFYLEDLADKEQLPPMATTVDRHLTKPEFQGWLWALVDVDIEPYMGGSIKKNVTLPKLLSKKIDDIVKTDNRYNDRSHFLQVAAMHELSSI